MPPELIAALLGGAGADAGPLGSPTQTMGQPSLGDILAGQLARTGTGTVTPGLGAALAPPSPYAPQMQAAPMQTQSGVFAPVRSGQAAPAQLPFGMPAQLPSLRRVLKAYKQQMPQQQMPQPARPAPQQPQSSGGTTDYDWTTPIA